MKTIFLGLVLSVSVCFANADTKLFQVEGMTCGSCVKAIKSKLCSSPEIKTCEVEVGKVQLTYNEGQTLSDQSVIEKIKSAGFKASLSTAVDGLEKKDEVQKKSK